MWRNQRRISNTHFFEREKGRTQSRRNVWFFYVIKPLASSFLLYHCPPSPLCWMYDPLYSWGFNPPRNFHSSIETGTCLVPWISFKKRNHWGYIIWMRMNQFGIVRYTGTWTIPFFFFFSSLGLYQSTMIFVVVDEWNLNFRYTLMVL
jgi:hypothetical protein